MVHNAAWSSSDNVFIFQLIVTDGEGRGEQKSRSSLAATCVCCSVGCGDGSGQTLTDGLLVALWDVVMGQVRL